MNTKYSDEIRFEDDGMMFLMEYINGTFYVLNYTVDYMFTVDYVYGEDNSTKEIKKHSFPEDMFITRNYGTIIRWSIPDKWRGRLLVR